MEIFDLNREEIVKFINLTKNTIMSESVSLYDKNSSVKFTLNFDKHEKAENGTVRTIVVNTPTKLATFCCISDKEMKWLEKWIESDFLPDYYDSFENELWYNGLPF